MTEAAIAGPGSQPARTFPDRTHALFLREGAGRFFWKLDDEGISLSGHVVRWSHDGMARERSFGDIALIHLQIGHVHKSGDVGTCRIAFRDGLVLTIYSNNARGYADEERAQAYAAFVRDLHARLAELAPQTIDYRAGNSENRHLFGIVMLVIAGLFFVGLPLVLFLLLRSWEVFGILGAGIAFVWPVLRVLQRSAPRTYSPRHVPDDLLP